MLQVDRKSEFLSEEEIGGRTSSSCLISRPIGEETLFDVEVPILSLTLASDCVAERLVVPFH